MFLPLILFLLLNITILLTKEIDYNNRSFISSFLSSEKVKIKIVLTQTQCRVYRALVAQLVGHRVVTREVVILTPTGPTLRV